jgi:hypothetical protein
MLRAIDADTHVFESPPVWDFLAEAMHPRRPIVVTGPRDTAYRRGSFWLIDGNIFPKSAGKGGFLLGTPTEPGQLETIPDLRARELMDIDGRLQAMDAMGVDSQVVYPTLFLARRMSLRTAAQCAAMDIPSTRHWRTMDTSMTGILSANRRHMSSCPTCIHSSAIFALS